jgi:hypothetical protein
VFLFVYWGFCVCVQFAAALWTLDASLEVAAAGGVGVNFHQGAGQNLYAAIIRW